MRWATVRWAAVAILSVPAACVTAVQPVPYQPPAVREVGQWEVRAGGRVLGDVLVLEIDGQGAPERRYQVRNAAGQWLGHLDEQLRVYRRVPFSMTDEFLGVHPMREGLAMLYDEATPVELVAAGEVAPAEASLRR